MLERVDNINFDELYVLLLDASRKAFRSVQAAHPDETFYTFGFHYVLFDFIVPLCNSEEAHMRLGNLTEHEREGKALEWFYARWAFDKWEYDASGKEFDSVSAWLKDNLDQFQDHEPQWAIWTTIHSQVAMICVKVLKILDEEKIFREGKDRESLVLSVETESWWYENIEEGNDVYFLNPISTYERWCFEQEMQRHAVSVLSSARFERNDE